MFWCLRTSKRHSERLDYPSKVLLTSYWRAFLTDYQYGILYTNSWSQKLSCDLVSAWSGGNTHCAKVAERTQVSSG